MQFREGASVVTSSDEKVGDLDRVVVDPLSGEVTHLVVREGLLFPQDKVIPVDLVRDTDEERVVLRAQITDPEAFPNFEEAEYIRLEEAQAEGGHAYRPGYAPAYYWYPPPGIGWWGTVPYPISPQPPYVLAAKRNIPEGTIPLREGAQVLSADGEEVGNVERVFAEPADDRVTHLLISQGLLLKERKLVPTTWIATVSENQVRLGVESSMIEDLPAYEEGD
jgi:uncharacterized protein YrrD